MAHFVTQRWEEDPGAMGGRRARASFSFQAFVPDPIADLQLLVSFEAADAVANAEEAIRALNEHAGVIGLEAVGPLLLRSEAVASSRLENIDVSTFNLARALIDPQHARGAAREVAANVAAMETAIAIGEKEADLTIDDLAELHRILMADGTRPQEAGHVRTVQNWIGGRLANPGDAVYIPPPAREVVRLLDDLVAFLNRSDMPAIAQAAIAHAQFETIHPFEDGNGRTGRCLVHLILRRRGLARHIVPPISIVLAARPTSYVAGLAGFREGKAVEWCLSFAAAAGRAAETSLALANRVAALQAEWRARAGNPRAGSAAAKTIAHLPAQPILSAGIIRAAIGSSHQRANDGLARLAASGVLRQIGGGTYDRTYAADELFTLVDAYERLVAHPDDDRARMLILAEGPAAPG
jgi:Fic family protein